MAFEDLLLVVSNIILLGLGTFIVLLSYSAYKRTGDTMMLFVSLGFGLVTLGSFIEGILFEFMGYSLMEVHLVESTIVLAGLLVLVHSLRKAA